MFLFFTYQLINLAITDQPTPQMLLLSSQNSPPKAITNSFQVKQLISAMQKNNVNGVFYTAKSKHLFQKVIQVIDNKLLSKWVFIQQNNNLYHGLKANRAFVSTQGKVCFGQGFQQMSVKSKLRLAACCALKLAKSQVIILQPKKDEAELARKQGYLYVYQHIISAQQLNNICIQATQVNKFENGFNQLQAQDAFQVLNKCTLLTQTPIFKSQYVMRTPKSKSISSIIFKNVVDHHLYIAKTDQIRLTGGNHHIQILQNIQLFSSLCQLFSVYTLPHYRIICNLKNSLIPSYQKAKANASVKPFIKKLVVLNQKIKNHQILSTLLEESMLEGKKVNGLGKAILMSLLCWENTFKKSLMQMVGYIEDQSNNEINIIRFDIHQVFDGKFQKEIEISRYSQKFQKHLLNKIGKYLVDQMKNLYFQISEKMPLINSFFNHYKWQFSKVSLYQQFLKRFSDVGKYFGFECSKQIKLNPIHYSLMVNNDYSVFQFHKSLGKFQNFQNQYLSLMKTKSSFIIYSTLPPIQKLLRWIARTWSQVQYVSFLTTTKQHYIMLSQKMKSQLEIDKKPKIIVADHCQLVPQILILHRHVRTIFISRLKKVECQLSVIQQLNYENGELFDTSEELFKSIIDSYDNCNVNYQLYLKTLNLWIQNKCQTYNISKILAYQKCRQLYQFVSKNQNRINNVQSKQLYALPVYKFKQKIYFIHDIQQFLSFHYLMLDILQDKWKGKLKSNHIATVRKWIKFFNKDINIIIKKLISFMQNNTHSYQERRDTVELLKNLTKKICLNDFMQYKYNQILKIVKGQEIYAVITKKNIFIYSTKFQIKDKILTLNGQFYQVYFLKNNLITQQLINKNEIEFKQLEIKEDHSTVVKKNIINYKQGYKYVYNENFIVCYKNNQVLIGQHIKILENDIIFIQQVQSKQIIICTTKTIYKYQQQNLSQIMNFQSQIIKGQVFKINSQLYICFLEIGLKKLTILNLKGKKNLQVKYKNPILHYCINIQKLSIFIMQQKQDILQERDLITMDLKNRYYQFQTNLSQIMSSFNTIIIKDGFYAKKYKLPQ